MLSSEASSAGGLKGKDKKVQTMRALNVERVPRLDEITKKEVSTVTDNKAKAEIDSKNTDKLRLLPRAKVRQKIPVKGRTLPRTVNVREKYKDFGDEKYAHTTKFPTAVWSASRSKRVIIKYGHEQTRLELFLSGMYVFRGQTYLARSVQMVTHILQLCGTIGQ